ncbi:import motor complex subunit PAM16 [Pneumocystis jirovecii RU7]|uniref:Mitochondrial import inner membrane translocase subunit TIM16 n=1 Tax=Pneumocystis jirovecii (strain RU7) TaxID=1408657 RepID=A0A0W4ZJM9_PNEJ7|nr:import motor complex subunit PAM16 [Pneumocystis jirovecii RU7]KTW28593.1 hypothetical protein T551_02443 [Pneumocystis jirovecii RU7]
MFILIIKMAHQLIAQIIIVGTQILGRAFVQAYKQVAANAALKHAQNNIYESHREIHDTNTDILSQKTGITIPEACQILNIKKTPIELSDVIEKYEYLYKINDPKNGGSLYLQTKIFWAKERLKLDISQKKDI